MVEEGEVDEAGEDVVVGVVKEEDDVVQPMLKKCHQLKT
jgi:hypothetical protein